MQGLRVIKNRTKAINDIARITGALEIVALTRLKQRQNACLSSRLYFDKMRGLLNDITQNINFYSHPAFSRPENEKNVFFVLVGSDKGLCGNFNYNIVDAVRGKLGELSVQSYQLAVFGKRLKRILKTESKKIIFESQMLDENSLFTNAEALEGEIIKSFLSKKIDAVYLVYNHFRQQLLGKANLINLLPLQLSSGKDLSLVRDYIYQPEQAQIFDFLIKEYLSAQIYHALLESRVSEEMARMIAMKQATENAQELVDRLNIDYHKLRQMGITRELLDIVAATRG